MFDKLEEQEAQLPLDGAGAQLARARVAAGKSLADVAQITRISERQLAAIEAGNYAALPSRAYSVGFARTYAKAVGLDGNAIVALVREELAQHEPDSARRTLPAFEPGDPARLPGRRVAWLAGLGLVLVLIAGFLVWPSLYAPGGTLPSILPSPTASPSPARAPAAAVPGTEPVVFTATSDKVWVRFADGAGQQLLQKELALGESWTVPATAAVTLTTARPAALAVTIGGRPVPPLAITDQPLRDVPVTAAALLARAAPGPVPAAPATAAMASTPAPRRQSRAARSAAEQSPPAAPATEPSASAPPPATGPAAVTADSQG